MAAVFVTATVVVTLEKYPQNGWALGLGAVALTGVFLLWTFHGLQVALVALAIPAWLVLAIGGRLRRPWLVHFAPLVLPLWILTAFSGWLLLSRSAPHAPFQMRSEAEVQLAQWVASQTPVDAGFLTDPSWAAFRMLSRRSSFVTWKEGSGMLIYQPFARDWVKRLRALGVDPMDSQLVFPRLMAASSQAFAKLDDHRALDLGARFGLSYWIVSRQKVSALPVVHENEFAKILLLRPGRTAGLQ